jgi:hypothetical protein
MLACAPCETESQSTSCSTRPTPSNVLCSLTQPYAIRSRVSPEPAMSRAVGPSKTNHPLALRSRKYKYSNFATSIIGLADGQDILFPNSAPVIADIYISPIDMSHLCWIGLKSLCVPLFLILGKRAPSEVPSDLQPWAVPENWRRNP